jgi:hypothetical protein
MHSTTSKLLIGNSRVYFRQLLVISFCFVFTNSLAQEEKGRWLLGTGLTYCTYVDNPGLNLNVTYRVIGNLHIGPDFSALLTKEVNENGIIVKRKELEYNFNAQYLFEIGKSVSIYPLVGINRSKVTFHPTGQEPDIRWITALNAGGGIEIKIKMIRLSFESKWVSLLDKYDLTTGILFTL